MLGQLGEDVLGLDLPLDTGLNLPIQDWLQPCPGAPSWLSRASTSYSSWEREVKPMAMVLAVQSSSQRLYLGSVPQHKVCPGCWLLPVDARTPLHTMSLENKALCSC